MNYNDVMNLLNKIFTSSWELSPFFSFNLPDTEYLLEKGISIAIKPDSSEFGQFKEDKSMARLINFICVLGCKLEVEKKSLSTKLCPFVAKIKFQIFALKIVGWVCNFSQLYRKPF